MRGELALSFGLFWAVLMLAGCRAFADYIFGSVVLHFFCVNFIN